MHLREQDKEGRQCVCSHCVYKTDALNAPISAGFISAVKKIFNFSCNLLNRTYETFIDTFMNKFILIEFLLKGKQF